MEEEGPTTVTTVAVVTKVPSTEVTTGDVTAATPVVVGIAEAEKVDEAEVVLGVEDEREVVADVEDREEDVVDKVVVGVLDVDGAVVVVVVPSSGKSWAFVLIEKKRSTRTKDLIRWNWKGRSRARHSDNTDGHVLAFHCHTHG